MLLTIETRDEKLKCQLKAAGWRFLRLFGNEETWLWPHVEWPKDPRAA